MDDRRIGYRAWHKYLNKWHYFRNPGGIWVAAQEQKHSLWDYERWCPDTALDDKNGKMIYGGDILGGFGDGNERVCYKVAEGRWCLETAKGHVAPLNISGAKWRKIIGNIYEHPELLK